MESSTGIAAANQHVRVRVARRQRSVAEYLFGPQG